jgi:hypothetical protein
MAELKDIALRSSYKEQYLNYLQGRKQASMLLKDQSATRPEEETTITDNT